MQFYLNLPTAEDVQNKNKAKKTPWNVNGLMYAATLSKNLMVTWINMFEKMMAEIAFYFFFSQAFISWTKTIHRTLGGKV